MKLIAKDQIHISGVQADTLRPGQVFEVGEDRAHALLAAHPAILAVVDEASTVDAPPAAAAGKRKK